MEIDTTVMWESGPYSVTVEGSIPGSIRCEYVRIEYGVLICGRSDEHAVVYPIRELRKITIDQISPA